MTPSLHALLVLIHLAGVIVWVGGMVFAQFALRPAAMQVLEPPKRLPLMAQALGRFFHLVAIAVVAILLTGWALLANVGMAQAPVAWHVMLTVGVVMALMFAFIYFRLTPALCAAVAASQWPVAGAALNRIRVLILINLCLGAVAVAAAVLARA